MTFCSVVNCVDGRVQLPVITHLQKRFDVDHVDSVTEPGPIRILSTAADGPQAASIRQRLEISVQKHGSVGIALVGHHDCAGNPESKDIQLHQLAEAAQQIRTWFPKLEIICLWVDENWQVNEVTLA